MSMVITKYKTRYPIKNNKETSLVLDPYVCMQQNKVKIGYMDSGFQ